MSAVRLLGLSFAVAGVIFGGCASDETPTVTQTVVKSETAEARGHQDKAENAATARPEPTDRVRRYYELVDAERYGTAWPLLPATVQSEAGGFATWRHGYDATIFTKADVSLQSRTGSSAVVAVRLSSAARDACTDRSVPQGFGGTWAMERTGGTWVAVDTAIQQVSGGTPELDPSACPKPPTEPPSPPPDDGCTPGYSPCLPLASDYDCEGGTGNGPEYTGTVQVSGSDPYGLDADANGVGCEYDY